MSKRSRWPRCRLVAHAIVALGTLTFATASFGQYVYYFDSNQAAINACQQAGAAITFGTVSCPIGHLNALRTCYDLVVPGIDPNAVQCGSNGQCFCGPAAPQVCKVAPLTAITDPVVSEHESGRYQKKPDLEHVLPATAVGGACLKQRTEARGAKAVITSGFRPQGYQDHLREVWDKWQLLKNDSSQICATVRAAVASEFSYHGLVRRPVENSRHTAGRAIDMTGVPGSSADMLATECNMFRPEPVTDYVHFEIPR